MIVRSKQLESEHFVYDGGGDTLTRTGYFNKDTFIIPLIPSTFNDPVALFNEATLQGYFVDDSSDFVVTASAYLYTNWFGSGWGNSIDQVEITLRNWLLCNFNRSTINPNGWDLNLHFYKDGTYYVPFVYFGNQATSLDLLPGADVNSLHKANSLALSDNANVTSFPASLGGSSFDFASVGTAPKFKVTQLNGLAAVRFVGTGGLLKEVAPANMFANGDGLAMHIVMKSNVAASAATASLIDYGLDEQGLGVVGLGFQVNDDSTGVVGCCCGVVQDPLTDAVDGEWQIYTVIFANVGGAMSAKFWVNGIGQSIWIDTAQPNLGVTAPNDNLCLGVDNATQALYAAGDVAEVIILNFPLTDTVDVPSILTDVYRVPFAYLSYKYNFKILV